MGAGGMTTGAGGADGEGGADGIPEGGDTGMGGAGETGDPACPEAPAPGDGTTCTTPGLGCGYPVNTCSCVAETGEWTCFSTAEECPDTPPASGTDCAEEDTACAYGEQGTCACLPPAFGGGLDWQCDDGIVACPGDEPADASDCADFATGFECTYGDSICTCGADDEWTCEEDDGCPAMAPDTDAPCDIPLGNVCEYAGGGGTSCACTVNGWLCS
jgi:hypothetical protein